MTNSASYDVLASDLFFPEGPVALPDGSVLIVELGRRQVTRVRPDGTKEAVANVKGAPNGSAFGPDGKLYFCNNGGGFAFGHVAGITQPVGEDPTWSGGGIDRVDLKTGKVEELVREVDGKPLLMPNDLVFDRHGGCYFTDHGMRHARNVEFGGLYYRAPDGTTKEVVYPIWTANGVGLSPDESLVYVADTETGLCWRYEILKPGVVKAGPPNEPGTLTLPRVKGFRRYDSLAVEANGNVCLASLTPGGITVVSPAGELVEFVEFPDPFVTNICFGGPDMRTAYITLSGTGQLVRMKWPRPGLPLNFTPQG